MDAGKKQIQLQLIANMLVERCKHQPGIIFRESLCSQARCIRFATPLLQEIFPPVGRRTGAWNSGDLFLYEIYNGERTFCITASLSGEGFSKKQEQECRALCAVTGNPPVQESGVRYLRVWDYPDAVGNPQKIMSAVSAFFEKELPVFESEMGAWQRNRSGSIHTGSTVPQTAADPDELEGFTEGAAEEVLSKRFERNPAARRRCIAVHGTTCQICGFDFGAVYGPEFHGTIDVHHKVPLSEIREDYVVDPVEDLIPVCPNCHRILHSKPGGVYTVDEVKQMLKRFSSACDSGKTTIDSGEL